jgi:hypothetical protein
MIALLSFRNLVLRPWRTLLLLLGFGLGVGVMIVLLSVGEALLAQAREEKLVGGGQLTVLPEGLDVEVMKTGGLGGMFFSIDHARFIYRQLLAAPRLAPHVAAVAPEMEGKLVYLRLANGREIAVRAAGELPSRTRAVGALPDLAAGHWDDDDLDRRWRDPTMKELRAEVDHFHLPTGAALGDPSWAEWHYVNVISADGKRWAFISFIVGGEVPRGIWGAQVLVTLHEVGQPARRFSSVFPPTAVHFSTNEPDLSFGSSAVRVLPDGRYEVVAHAREEKGDAPLDIHLVVTPSPGAYFPGAALSAGDLVSGYAVAALRADASGSICVAKRCEDYQGVQAYHDHNWGVWRGVTWEWGSARAGSYALLYGRVQPPDSVATRQPLFVFLVDSLGFLALFRPRDIAYVDERDIVVDGKRIHVPSHATMVDVRGDDTLRVELAVEDAAGTDTRAPGVERGDTRTARQLLRPYFIQMKGSAEISGRVHGAAIAGRGQGFFETYR